MSSYITYDSSSRTYRVRVGDRATNGVSRVQLVGLIGDGCINDAVENAAACPGVEIPVFSRARVRTRHTAVRQ